MRVRARGGVSNWLWLAANRLIWLPPTLFGLLSFVFILSRVIPIDPAVLAAGDNASAAQVDDVRRRFGLDEPLPLQFIHYLRDVMGGDLGTSFYTQQPIAHDLILRIPATLELTLV